MRRAIEDEIIDMGGKGTRELRLLSGSVLPTSHHLSVQGSINSTWAHGGWNWAL